VFKKAKYLRKHAEGRCQNSGGVKIRARKDRESKVFVHILIYILSLLIHFRGHTWCRLSERKELPSSAIEPSLNSENGIVDNDPPPVQLIWTPLNPCGSKIDWMRTLVVPFRYTVEELPSKLPWLDGGDLEKIKKELGNQFVVNTKGNEQPDVHQGVVTMQILKHISNCKVDVRAWRKFWKAFVEQDETKVMDSRFRDANGQALNTIILLHWTEEESWVEDEMCQFYMRLERLRAYHGASIRCIPSYTEALQARGKIQDIRALDEDAIKRKQYRPKTCYPGGVCCLSTEEKTVHKRQDSCGKAHVLVKTKGQRGALTCSVKPTMPTECMANGPLWFHQEFVDTIEKLGEFRAFIVTEPDPKGLRGRKGKIVCIAHTTWRTKDGAEMHVELVDDRMMHVQLVDDRTFNDINCEHLTRKGLEDYFLRRFEYLRRRPDWKEKWATLEIGVRLDAAISPHGAISPAIGEEGFWLVEPTRIYFADFFSDFIHGEPKYRLCEEIAHSIARYLSIQKR
jgi:hypothetical protein